MPDQPLTQPPIQPTQPPIPDNWTIPPWVNPAYSVPLANAQQIHLQPYGMAGVTWFTKKNNNLFQPCEPGELEKMTETGDVENKDQPMKEQPEEEDAGDPTENSPTKRKNAPLEGRVSVFCGVYPKSKEEEWTFVPMVGWYHLSEEPLFSGKYVTCPVTGIVTRKALMICYRDENWNKVWVNKRAAPKLGLMVDGLNGSWVRREDCVEALNSEGVPALSHKVPVSSSGGLFTCDYDHRVYFPGPIEIHGSKKYKQVSGYAALTLKAFRTCCECEKYYESGEIIPRGTGGFTSCPTCYSKMLAKNAIKPYNNGCELQAIYCCDKRFTYRRSSDGLFESTGVRESITDSQLFGVEIETEFDVKYLIKHDLKRWDMANEVVGALGKHFVEVKEDGSLTLNGKYGGPHMEDFAMNGDGSIHAGVEICSAPAGIEAHRKMWPKLLNMPNYKALRSWDAPTCALHIHMDRRAITNLQLGKMLHFINNKASRKFMRAVAGRGGNKFCVYKDKKFSDAIHPENVISAAEKGEYDRNRRVALNLSHPGTIEFRGFQGSVWPRRIIRCIEFCAALIKFTYPCTLGLSEYSDHKNFIKFIDEQRKTYPLFAEWLGKKGWIKIKTPGPKADLDKLTLKINEVKEDGVMDPNESDHKETTAEAAF